MTARKAAPTNVFLDWGIKNAALLFTVVGLLVTFYFTTKQQLENHTQQITEIAKKFDNFDNTQRTNFDRYAANQKEEKLSADKAREALQGVVNILATGQAAGAVKVENISKTLDGVVQKLDVIQSNQKLPTSSRR